MRTKIKSPCPRLEVVAGFIEHSIPNYDIKSSNPIEASMTGKGNCVTKSIIGAVLLDKLNFIGSDHALAYNSNTHPRKFTDLLGNKKVHGGHVQLLVVTSNADSLNPMDSGITSISFNPDSVANSDFKIYPFNSDDDTYAVSDGQKITATEFGCDNGYIIGEWHSAARQYMSLQGNDNSVFHNYTHREISSAVLENLNVTALTNTAR